MSPREQLANRIAEFLTESEDTFSNVLQGFMTRDDGRPGGGRLITFEHNGIHFQLVVWDEKRLDFNTSITPDAWTRFHSESEFYEFAITTFSVPKPRKE